MDWGEKEDKKDKLRRAENSNGKVKERKTEKL